MCIIPPHSILRLPLPCTDVTPVLCAHVALPSRAKVTPPLYPLCSRPPLSHAKVAPPLDTHTHTPPQPINGSRSLPTPTLLPSLASKEIAPSPLRIASVI